MCNSHKCITKEVLKSLCEGECELEHHLQLANVYCNTVYYFVPVVFIGKGVEVFLLLMYDVLQAFIDWCTAVSYLLQHSLKDDHIANHRIFQHVNLQDTEIVNMRWKRIRTVQNLEQWFDEWKFKKVICITLPKSLLELYCITLLTDSYNSHEKKHKQDI